MPSKRHGTRICVPQRAVQGGLGEKFESDPYDVELHGLMTEHQYTEAIENLNAKLKPSRPTSLDGALLVTGPLMVPLALWGARHRNQTKRRKKLLNEGIREFNMQYQELYMRWNRRPESTLTIERRHSERAPSAAAAAVPESEMAEATLVSVAPAARPEGGGSGSAAALTPVHHHQILQQRRQQEQQQQQSSDQHSSSGLV